MSTTRLKQYRLPNGLKVAAYRYPRAAGTTILVDVGVGPMHESSTDPAGISHLAEHLMVKRIQEAMIAASGPDDEVVAECLGTTRTDQTEFAMTVHRSDLDRALAGVRSLFDDVLPDDSVLSNEKKVIRHEQGEQGQDSEAIYQSLVRKSLYKGRAAESFLGSGSSLRRIDRKRLGRFLKKWYRPENARLTLVGAIPASLGKSLRPLGRIRKAGAVADTGRTAASRRHDTPVRITRSRSSRLQLLYVQSVSVSAQRYPAWEFLTDALDSFLFYRTRERGLAYTQDLNLIVSPHFTGQVIESTLRPNDLVKYAEHLRDSKGEFFAGLNPRRLSMLKKAYRKKLELRSDSSEKQTDQLAWSQYALGTPMPLEEQASLVSRLTMAGVRDLHTELAAEPAQLVCIGSVVRKTARMAQSVLSR